MKEKKLKNRLEAAKEGVVAWSNDMADHHGMLGTARMVIREFREKEMSRQAVYFAYYAFIAVFPMVLIMTAILGFVVHSNPAREAQILDAVYSMFPDFDVGFKKMIEFADSGRFVSLSAGILVFLWSGTKAAEALEDGFDSIWEAERRPFARRKGVAAAILFFFGTLTVAELLLSLMSSSLLPWAEERVGGGLTAGAFIGGVALALAVAFFMYVVIYRLVPARKPPVNAVLKGSLIIAVLGLVVDYGFGFYFNFVYGARFLYGTIGVLLGILMWLYVVAAVVFLGALLVWKYSGRPAPVTVTSSSGVGPKS